MQSPTVRTSQPPALVGARARPQHVLTLGFEPQVHTFQVLKGPDPARSSHVWLPGQLPVHRNTGGLIPAWVPRHEPESAEEAELAERTRVRRAENRMRWLIMD